MNKIGKKFNRLKIIKEVSSTNKNKKYLCECDCGNLT